MFEFYKYEGTGNDFIMVDDRSGQFGQRDSTVVAQLCHRRFGIGADGLILIRPPEGPYSFRMVYFNADGREGSMCGNGGRCAAHFASFLGVFAGSTEFVPADGPHRASVSGRDVALGMKPVGQFEKHSDGAYFLDTGSPHHVAFVDKVENVDVFNQGRAIRHSGRYMPGGTNVNFVALLDGSTLDLRTFERGVEDETYSCGTGATAAALAASLETRAKGPLIVRTLGGELTVSFERQGDSFTNIVLSGLVKQVFRGEAKLSLP